MCMRMSDSPQSSFFSPEDSLPTEPPTPPTKTSEALRVNLRSVNLHLEEMKEKWANEKRELLGEKAVLQDAAKRLNSQIREVKGEASKAAELQRAESRNRQDGEAVSLSFLLYHNKNINKS
jgi:hypothetical protein